MDAENSKPLRIMVADDHPLLREGIAGAIGRHPDLEVVGEAESGEEAVALFSSLRPDVVLMDLQMPGIDGVEAISQIRSEHPAAKVIVLTTYSGDIRAMRALKAGASGYLLKSAIRTDLIEAIRDVSRGKRALPPAIAGEIADHAMDDPLTVREVEVLRCLAKGSSNKVIAWQLSISEDTVKTHMKGILGKLNAPDRTTAVTIAAKRGIIDL